jgi:hypothetical protein
MRRADVVFGRIVDGSCDTETCDLTIARTVASRATLLALRRGVTRR